MVATALLGAVVLLSRERTPYRHLCAHFGPPGPGYCIAHRTPRWVAATALAIGVLGIVGAVVVLRTRRRTYPA
jgi:hypothetical protein